MYPTILLKKLFMSLKRKIKTLIIFKDRESIIITYTTVGVVFEKQTCFISAVNSTVIILWCSVCERVKVTEL